VQKFETPDIYRDLHRLLTMGGFGPGEKLLPEPLRTRYGCSANTLREVLMRLSSVGLVAFEEQRGFRARRTSFDRRRDLTKFRIMLEQEGVALSIRNGGVDWEAQLAAAHHKLSHIQGVIHGTGKIEPLLDLWCTAEWEFHDALCAACDSPLLRETFRTIYDQFRQQLITRERNFGYFPENVAEHQQIVDAALRRDEPACRALIHAHLERNMTED
jgi:DNA-binding GntR family transcriptional regulator